MEIRAHHLLCMLGFPELGRVLQDSHSKEFVWNMNKVAQRIKSGPNLTIEVVVTCDAICTLCPYCAENKCMEYEGAEEDNRDMDLEILKRLGLKPKSKTSVKNVYSLVKQQITPSVLFEICKDCRWLQLGYCVEGVKKRVFSLYWNISLSEHT